MNTQVIFILIAIFLVLSIISISTMLFSKKKNNTKRNEANNRNKILFNNSNIAKIVLWIDLESINNNPTDESRICYSKIKSNLTGLMETVDILLIEPGNYNLVVNSREYTNIKINVTIEPDTIYQLGANEDGPFFIIDPQPNRYQLTDY